MIHGSQIILPDNLLIPSCGGTEGMEKEVIENYKRAQTGRGKVEKDVSKRTTSTTCSSQVFSIDNVTKDQFEPLTHSIVTETSQQS